MRSGIAFRGTDGNIVSTFCGSNQVPEVQTGAREEGIAVPPSERTCGPSTRDGGAGTSSPGGSVSNFGGSGLPSESGDHAHKRKGRGKDGSDGHNIRMLSVRSPNKPNHRGDTG